MKAAVTSSKIMRRGHRHGRLLARSPFHGRKLDESALAEHIRNSWEEQCNRVLDEEESFFRTHENGLGLKKLEEDLDELIADHEL